MTRGKLAMTGKRLAMTRKKLAMTEKRVVMTGGTIDNIPLVRRRAGAGE